MSPADAVHIKLPDGSQREYPRGVTAAEIAQSIGTIHGVASVRTDSPPGTPAFSS